MRDFFKPLIPLNVCKVTNIFATHQMFYGFFISRQTI